jgi:hypothetical protein
LFTGSEHQGGEDESHARDSTSEDPLAAGGRPAGSAAVAFWGASGSAKPRQIFFEVFFLRARACNCAFARLVARHFYWPFSRPPRLFQTLPYNWFAGASWRVPAMTRGTKQCD